MSRGTTEHRAAQAAAFLASDVVKGIRNRMEVAVTAKIRQTNIADPDQCRAVVVAYQQHALFWSLLEQETTLNDDVRERVAGVV